jgi:hypothetical protein
MRLFRHCWLLAILPFLSGCITSLTMDSANTRTFKTLPDAVDRIEQASITRDNNLLIFIEARMTNSVQRGQYTLIVPLAGIQANTTRYPSDSTNMINVGSLKLPRNRVLDGWAAKEGATGDWKAVPIGAPIVMPEGGNLWSDVSKYKVLPGADRTIYQITDLRSTNRYDGPVPMVFIYVDARSNRAFSFLQVEPVTYWTAKRSEKKLWLLPFTIPLDLATIPVQLPYILLMMNSTKS